MDKLLSGANLKKVIAAIIFIIFGFYVEGIVPTTEIAWVMALLLLTIYLFVFEIVEVDVAAVTVMVLLGLTSLIAPFIGLEQGLVDNKQLFIGFSGNAVMSIIAVMIIGAGLDRTGIMTKVAAFILKVGGSTETRIIPIISSTVGIISSFMQNVGAAALFLPVVSRISSRSGLSMSRLLMPMGFCAILGGTVTMVGSSPLILLNDLILTTNQGLKESGIPTMDTWDLFSVTPIGLALVASGIVYFVVFGRFVLPAQPAAELETAANTLDYFKKTYGMDMEMVEVRVPDESTLIGMTLDEFEPQNKVRTIAAYRGSEGVSRIGAGALARDTAIEPGMALGLLGDPDDLKTFISQFALKVNKDNEVLSEVLASTKAGIAEIVIPPASSLIGKSARDVWMRKTYGLSLLGLHRGEETIEAGHGVRDIPLQAGDTLIVHTSWIALARLEKDRDFVIVTTEYPREEERPHKLIAALIFFAIALSLILFTDIRLSVALLTGAIGMVLTNVLSMEEAYKAVSWKTVFLLASLIPLGLAVETSGTAAWIAERILHILGEDTPAWVLQLSIALLATFFTLVMSNVGATVLLVPLAVNIAIDSGANPAVFALTVAIATSNSFLIPTHQVNALIMGPGGYRVPDFIKAGGIMTILFIVVMMVMLNVVFTV
jgi:di/tricarboxylate transporter